MSKLQSLSRLAGEGGAKRRERVCDTTGSKAGALIRPPGTFSR
jgi:hypothetical protein